MKKTAREKILFSLDALVTQDTKRHIPYLRGGRVDIQKGLDCSGLVYYTIKQAGLNSELFTTSRAIFTQFPAQLVQCDAKKRIKTTLKNIQQGDLLFWNSIDRHYELSVGPIQKVFKRGQAYRIHHIAFIDAINYNEGTIDIIESNSSQGFIKHTINVHDQRYFSGKRNSELYAAHIDFTSLEF